MTNEQIELTAKQIDNEVTAIFQDLEKDVPHIKKRIAEGVGIAGGVGAGYGLLTVAGINGLSAAGISSGLAAIGGTMVTGIGVLVALPIAGIYIGQHIAKKKHEAKAIDRATKKLITLLDEVKQYGDCLKYKYDEINTKFMVLQAKRVK